MSKRKTTNRKRTPSALPSAVRAWTPEARQAHADGVRLRAATIQGKRRPAAQAREWAA